MRPSAPPDRAAAIAASASEALPIGSTAPAAPAQRPIGIAPLTLGGNRLHIPVTGTSADLARARQSGAADPSPATARAPSFATDDDVSLTLVAARSRLKARACEVVVRRRASPPGHAAYNEVKAEIDDLITKARAKRNGVLWMLLPDKPQPADGELGLLARCFDNLAFAAELARDAEGDRALLEQAVRLLAEAQSAVRAVAERSWLTRPDMDQEDAFRWLRRTTEERQIYVDRYMQLGDIADPAQWDDLRVRLAACRDELDAREAGRKATRNALDKFRYHAKRLNQVAPEDAGADWLSLSEKCGVLRQVGVALRDARIREILAQFPPASPAPADADKELVEIVEELADGRDAPEADEQPSDMLLRVRDALCGRRVVMVGGRDRAHQRERLAAALMLDELDWVDLREHASSAPLEAAIANPRTAAVLVIIKLTGHQHADDARRWCRQYGKPLVVLKAGFNPEQVAAAMSEQMPLVQEPRA